MHTWALQGLQRGTTVTANAPEEHGSGLCTPVISPEQKWFTTGNLYNLDMTVFTENERAFTETSATYMGAAESRRNQDSFCQPLMLFLSCWADSCTEASMEWDISEPVTVSGMEQEVCGVGLHTGLCY